MNEFPGQSLRADGGYLVCQCCKERIPLIHSDVEEFTKKVLKFFADHGSKFPEWSLAARIVFSFTPNSASCERVFSLLRVDVCMCGVGGRH